MLENRLCAGRRTVCRQLRPDGDCDDTISPFTQALVRLGVRVANLHWFIFVLFSDNPWSNLVQELSRVYAQNLMRSKLIIAILVLALSGANSGAASMCAVFCTSSASVGSAVAHHHQMESQPGPASISRHIHGLHHSANCAECPLKSGNSLNQKADCTSLVQLQMLKEASFSLDAPSGVPQFDADDTPRYALGLACDGETSLVSDAPRTIRTFSSASVPLRI
jgi:hypothetical protein